MSYTPINWQTGDVITADKLNHMEDGIANAGSLVVTSSHEDSPEGSSGDGYDVLSATWQQIKDAYDACIPVYYPRTTQGEGSNMGYLMWCLQALRFENGVYYVDFGATVSAGGSPMSMVYTFSASTPNDYPSYGVS